MPELDFDALREAVENDTFIPEFVEIRRRARRHKRWRVLVNTARILGILTIAMPGLLIADVVFTHIYRPVDTNNIAAGVSDGNGNGALSDGSTTATVTSAVVAVDGIDSAHTYALVDVCLNHSCNLQLSQVNPTPTAASPQSIGLIRTVPTQRLTGMRLILANESTAYVSAVPANSPRVQVPIAIQPAAGAITAVPRPVQISTLGTICAVTGGSGTPMSIPAQPSVSGPELVSTNHGWWVTGTAPDGYFGVSVSHDYGATWTTHSTGYRLAPSLTDNASNSAFATIDGTDMFVLLRTITGMKLLYSTDGGTSWHPINTTVSWPASTSFSLVATDRGVVIASFTYGSSTSYLTSIDYGATFKSTNDEPRNTGNVVRVGSELITLGTHSQISTDGLNWQSALIQTVAPSIR
jgi:hypothetical protein